MTGSEELGCNFRSQHIFPGKGDCLAVGVSSRVDRPHDHRGLLARVVFIRETLCNVLNERRPPSLNSPRARRKIHHQNTRSDANNKAPP